MVRQEQLSGALVARREARERQRLFAEGHLIGRSGEPVEVLSVSALGQDGRGVWHRAGTRTAVAATQAGVR